MKIPQTPPDIDYLAFPNDGEKLSRLIRIGPAVNGKYLHWDRLRYYADAKPEGLTLEEWWFGIKLARSQQYRQIPLEDPDGRPFFYGLVDPLPEFLHRVDFQTGGFIGAFEPVTNPSTKRRYLVRSLIEEAFTSSQLEGAATTRERAKEMIRKNQRPRDRGELMVLNNYRTMEFILGLQNQPLTPDLLLEIQRQITIDTLENPNAAGRFRREGERVVVADPVQDIVYHDPPPANQLKARMDRLCAFANGDGEYVHPVIRSMILHFWLAYDHPFVDGNGRTARALFYWSMLRNKYWLFEYVSISQFILKGPSSYGRAFLETETDGNDLTYFLLYHAEVVGKAIDSLTEYLERKAIEVTDAGEKLRDYPGLNHRQRTVLASALRHPGEQHTVESYCRTFGVVKQTARNDLEALVELNLFQKSKTGRAFVYYPARDLTDRVG